MKQVLVGVGVYLGIGVVAELAFVFAVNRRRASLSQFAVTRALTWPLLAYNVVAGKTVLSNLPGVEPAPPNTVGGAAPGTAVNPPELLAARGSTAHPGGLAWKYEPGY